MTREEAEAQCRELASEHRLEFISIDLPPLTDDGEPGTGVFELQLFNPRTDMRSTLQLQERDCGPRLAVLLDRWLGVLAQQVKRPREL
jgi:hypothetical protein